MATLVNTKIVINEPIKNKVFGYFITVDKKHINYLTIKAVDYKGRSKGVIGRVNRNGSTEIRDKHRDKLDPMLNTKTMQTKINMTLDLIYGYKRTEIAKVFKGGLAKFNHTISRITEPRNYSNLGGR